MGAKMDRTLSRTPSDTERKFGLGQSQSAPDSSAALELKIQQLSQTVTQYMTKINTEIETLQAEVETLKNAQTTTYTVKFFDTSNVEIASYTVKQGESVNEPPLTDVKWVNSEGIEVTFPYTPTSDTNLYVYQ